jgi:hypothetical protein
LLIHKKTTDWSVFFPSLLTTTFSALFRCLFRQQCDFSLTSHVTRIFEGTETKAAALAELATDFPRTVTFTPQTIPTHAKYFICQRRGAEDSAVFGGVNIGDRFASWRCDTRVFVV